MVLASNNTIWRKLWGDALNGPWTSVPGLAIDIGGGPIQGGAPLPSGEVGQVENYVFVLAPDQSIWGWDEQLGLVDVPPGPGNLSGTAYYDPEAENWLPLGGFGREISAGRGRRTLGDRQQRHHLATALSSSGVTSYTWSQIVPV